MTFPEFIINVESLDPETVAIKPHGELDVQTAPQLKEFIGKTLENDQLKNLAVDLREVSFIDSTTLGVLIGTLKKVKNKQGKMVLICNDPAILQLIHITGLHRIFELKADLESGLKYLHAPTEED